MISQFTHSAFHIPHSALRTPHSEFPIVLALGCNVGPRRETLDLACRLLEQGGVRVVRRSRLYWTRPWGVTDQPDFINAAVMVKTGLSPRALLARCQGVENRLGRRRERHWGPRRVDLDLVLYGAIQAHGAQLTLPHPRLAERDFVLAPLIDLNVPPPRAVAPHGWPALLRRLAPESRTIIHAEPWR